LNKHNGISVKRASPTDIRVGVNLRELRLARHLSQQELGSQLGITFQQIQKYERGANRIGAGRLFQIAKLFGVSVQFFFAEPGSQLELGADVPGPAEFLAQIDQIEAAKDRRQLLTMMKRFAARRD
jgi:transcriptional regulator with XRE-family HTH domain